MRLTAVPLVLLLLAAATDVHLHAANGDRSETSPDSAILRQQGVTLDREGVSKLLRDMRPTDTQRERIAALILQLGSDEYREREAATEALIRMPHPPVRELREAAKGEDAEVRWRAKRILAAVEGSSGSAVLFAACRVIVQKKLAGLAEDLAAAATGVDSEPTRTAVRLAMIATARPDDAAALAKAMQAGPVEVRIAALWGLTAARGKSAIDSIEPLLADAKQPPSLRLAAAEAMVLQERRSGVAALVDLLDADSLAVRREAARLLRALSGKEFDFNAEGPEADRAKQRDSWAAWLKTDGRIAAIPALPKARWTDFFDQYLVYGEYEKSRTEFVKGVPKLLREHFKTVARTADTTGSVTDRHRSAKWLYPIEGKGERPVVVVEEGQRLYPIWGSWQQRWQDWIVLNENSAYIENAAAHGGPHWESRLEYVVVPLE